MKPLCDISIRHKQTLIILLTSGVALLLACSAFVIYDLAIFRGEMVEKMSSLAEVVGNNTTAALDFNDPTSARESLASLRGEPTVTSACIYDKEGRPFAAYTRADSPILAAPPVQTGSHEFADEHLLLFRTIKQGGEAIGTIYIAANLDEFTERVTGYVGIAAVVLVGSLLVALIVSSRLQRVISLPILQLAAAARTVAQDKNYSLRAKKHCGDELGELVDGFNEMLAEIQERDFALQAARDTLTHSVQERTAALRQEIAERQRSEAALRESHQRFEIVTRTTSDVIWDWDVVNEALWWNENIQKVFGYSLAEMGGGTESWTSRIHPEDAPVILADIHAAFEAGEPMWSGEYRFRRSNGDYARVFDRGQILRDEQGRVIRMIGALQDITERKRAERTTAAFSKLGRQLSGAASREAAARIIGEVSNELFSWDAFSIQLYSRQDDTVCSIFEVDTIEGRRVEAPDNQPRKSTALHHRIFESGAELVLRDGNEFLPRAVSFGDQARPSASLMYVPIRAGNDVVGLLSIHSYSPHAYTEQNLTTLQTLTNHCGSALKRIEADEALRRTEELYRQAIAGADAVPYSYRYETKSYAFMGAGIQKLIGYAPEEMNPGQWHNLIKESVMLGETAGLTKAEAARRVSRGELRQWRCDMLVTTRDGKSRWISDSSVQELDAAGKPVGSMGILQDITERKQAEITSSVFSKLGRRLSVAASREEASRLMGEVSDDLFGWDAFSIQVYSSPDDMVNIIYEIDTFEGQRVESTVAHPRRATVLHHRIFESGAELILRDATAFLPEATSFGNRSRPSASIMYAPIRSAAEIVGLLSIHSYSPNAYTEQDLATLQTLADHCGGTLQRIAADEALRESETQFRLVWDTSVDGMRLSSRDGMVLMVNDAYCRMVEKTKAEVELQPLTVIHCAGNAEQVLRDYQEKFNAAGGQSNLETEVILWNGRKVWFELSNSILNLPGQPTLLLSIFRNITERKAAEAELESMHRQLLGVSRQAGMAEVATSVLHNVGNVLNSVNTSAGILTDRLRTSRVSGVSRVSELLETNRHDLAGFLTANGRAGQVINFLKSLSEHLTAENASALGELQGLTRNIEHIKEIVAMQQSYARISGVTETVRPTELVEDALRMNAGALAREPVRLVREYAPDVPEIRVEKHKVLQVLVNLIRNAKHACDDFDAPDKSLTLRVTHDDHHVQIAVVDNGVGVPPENLTRIFSHGFTTRKHGHGFGLHSGALAARELGGSLTVHSDGPGRGAVFTLELPTGSKGEGNGTARPTDPTTDIQV